MHVSVNNHIGYVCVCVHMYSMLLGCKHREVRGSSVLFTDLSPVPSTVSET